MAASTQDYLPWKIEAFREYLSFETLQQAAAVLMIYEGEVFDIRNPRILEMQKLLALRTNKNAWIPNRSGSEHVNWNVEGDVTRNKGRVFTSMLILKPKEWSEDKVVLTEFGKALANGKVSRKEYYDFIITRFKYPHPAWDENWDAWKAANKALYPFIYLLQVLVALYDFDPNESHLSVQEVADYLYRTPEHSKVAQYSKDILEARKNNAKPILERSDQVHRKISDILGFLCLTPYCYFVGNDVFLNLLSLHSNERAHFWEKRKGEDKLGRIRQLITTIS